MNRQLVVFSTMSMIGKAGIIVKALSMEGLAGHDKEFGLYCKYVY